MSMATFNLSGANRQSRFARACVIQLVLPLVDIVKGGSDRCFFYCFWLQVPLEAAQHLGDLVFEQAPLLAPPPLLLLARLCDGQSGCGHILADMVEVHQIT